MSPEVQHELENAVRLHQSGRLDEARAIYRAVLDKSPDQPDALHLSGMIDLAQGRLASAIERMRAALVSAGAKPAPHFHSNLANALRERGDLAEAEAEYRAAIAAGGGTPDVLNNLGIALIHLQRFEEAVPVLADSVRARPGHSGTLSNLAGALCKVGAPADALRYADAALALAPALRPALLARASALRLLGKASEACAATEQIVRDNPQDATGWLEHGFSLAAAGNHEDAIRAFEEAAARAPQSAEAHANLGASLLHALALDRAEPALRRALELAPRDAATWRNLASLLVHRQRLDEALSAAEQARSLEPAALNHAAVASVRLIRDELPQAETAYRAALELDSTLANAWNGLGVCLEKQGDDSAALDCYNRAIELRPDDAHAHLNRAIVLLLQGRMPEGWREYEWRLPWSRLQGAKQISKAPQWKPGDRTPDGSLPRILLTTEQGLGDAVQFIRFAPLVKPHASKLILAANAIVAPLAATVPEIDEVVASDRPLPPHDRAISLMSLPAALGTTLDTIPGHVPYLAVPRSKTDAWSRRVPPPPSGEINVALAWSGSPLNQHRKNRTIPLDQLRPFARVAGVRFYAVLKGPETAQIPSVLPWRITDLSPYLEDLGDTAAALDRMDLVISVDTSVAHLAGALAKPVWLMTFFPPDFRWLKNRTDSPWYPTMRIYRQTQRWVWGPIIEEVAHDLDDFVRRSLVRGTSR